MTSKIPAKLNAVISTTVKVTSTCFEGFFLTIIQRLSRIPKVIITGRKLLKSTEISTKSPEDLRILTEVMTVNARDCERARASVATFVKFSFMTSYVSSFKRFYS